MSTSRPPLHVIHNPTLHRFEINIDGSLAVLEYSLQDKKISFDHTFVPDNLRGMGIAALLVQAGLAEARQKGLLVIPACSYVATYLRRHPEAAQSKV